MLLAYAPAARSRESVSDHLDLVDRLARAIGASWGRSRPLGRSALDGRWRVALACPHEALGQALLEGSRRLAAAPDDAAVEDAVAFALRAWERPAEVALLARTARRRAIPVAWPSVGDAGRLVLGHGARAWTYAGGYLAGPGDVTGRDAADDKLATAARLQAAGLPSTRPVAVTTVAAAVRAARTLGFPVVLKPSRAFAQVGVHVGLHDLVDVRRAFSRATASAGWLGAPLLVERERRGVYVRATLVGGRLAAAFTAGAPEAIADGRRSVDELARMVFGLPERGALDRRSRGILQAVLTPQGLRPHDVLRRGRRVRVGFPGQGRVRDITARLHSGFRALLERVGRLFPLPIVGVDLIVADPTRPPDLGRDVILEVNANPSWAAHERPYAGAVRNLAPGILDVLFPAGIRADVPIVAGPPGSAGVLERLARRARDRRGVVPGGFTRGRAWSMHPRREIGAGVGAAALALLDSRTTEFYVEVDPTLAAAGLPFERVDRVIPAEGRHARDAVAIERWLRTLTTRPSRRWSRR